MTALASSIRIWKPGEARLGICRGEQAGSVLDTQRLDRD
jgi:hypothetical protein